MPKPKVKPKVKAKLKGNAWKYSLIVIGLFLISIGAAGLLLAIGPSQGLNITPNQAQVSLNGGAASTEDLTSGSTPDNYYQLAMSDMSLLNVTPQIAGIAHQGLVKYSAIAYFGATMKVSCSVPWTYFINIDSINQMKAYDFRLQDSQGPDNLYGYEWLYNLSIANPIPPECTQMSFNMNYQPSTIPISVIDSRSLNNVTYNIDNTQISNATFNGDIKINDPSAGLYQSSADYSTPDHVSQDNPLYQNPYNPGNQLNPIVSRIGATFGGASNTWTLGKYALNGMGFTPSSDLVTISMNVAPLYYYSYRPYSLHIFDSGTYVADPTAPDGQRLTGTESDQIGTQIFKIVVQNYIITETVTFGIRVNGTGTIAQPSGADILPDQAILNQTLFWGSLFPAGTPIGYQKGATDGAMILSDGTSIAAKVPVIDKTIIVSGQPIVTWNGQLIKGSGADLAAKTLNAYGNGNGNYQPADNGMIWGLPGWLWLVMGAAIFGIGEKKVSPNPFL